MFDYENEEYAELTAAVAAITVGESAGEPGMLEAGTQQLAVEIARHLPDVVGVTTAITVLTAAVQLLPECAAFGAAQGIHEDADLLGIRESVLQRLRTVAAESRNETAVEIAVAESTYGFPAKGGDA